MRKFALGHVSDDSHHLVTMEGCAWMVSTVSRVIAPTRATKASCVRTTLMTAEFPRAPTALSATTVLRTTVAVAMKAMQVCNRYLRSATPFTNYRLFHLWFPCAPQLSQHVIAGAGFLCSKADGLKEAVKQHSVRGTWSWCVHILLLLCSFSSLILLLPLPHLHHIPCLSGYDALKMGTAVCSKSLLFMDSYCNTLLIKIIMCAPVYAWNSLWTVGFINWNLVLVNWLTLFDTCHVSLKYGVMNIFDVKDVLNKSWKKNGKYCMHSALFLY